MSGDEFKLVVVSSTDWSWPAAALRDVVLAGIPGAQEIPAPAGTKFPLVLHVPETDGDGVLKLQMHESGRLVTLDYGSAELSARLVELIVRSLPPPDDVEVRLYEWGDNPRVTATTTARDLLAIGP